MTRETKNGSFASLEEVYDVAKQFLKEMEKTQQYCEPIALKALKGEKLDKRDIQLLAINQYNGFIRAQQNVILLLATIAHILESSAKKNTIELNVKTNAEKELVEWFKERESMKKRMREYVT